jgi:hypothetical protein
MCVKKSSQIWYFKNAHTSPLVLTVEISEPTERQNTALYSADHKVIMIFHDICCVGVYYSTKKITYIFK